MMKNTNTLANHSYANGYYTEFYDPTYGTYEEYVESTRNKLDYWWSTSASYDDVDTRDHQNFDDYHRFVEEYNFET